MKRFLVMGLLLFAGAWSIAAQDLIILRDGNIIEAKITEISQTEIKYYRFDNLAGPVFVIPVTNVLTIRYENAASQTFNPASSVNFGQFYQNQMLYWDFSKQRGFTLNLGNENWHYNAFRANIANDSIRKTLLEFPDSEEAYNSFKKNARIGNGLYWSGLAIILSALVPTGMMVNDPDNMDIYLGVYGGLLTSGLITSLIGVSKLNSSQENLFNAVNLYNRQKVHDLNTVK